MPVDSDCPIDLYVIVPANLKTIMKPIRFGINNVHIYTPFEVSEIVGIQTQFIKGSDKFADPLYFAIINKFSYYNKKLFTSDTKTVHWVFLNEDALIWYDRS